MGRFAASPSNSLILKHDSDLLHRGFEAEAILSLCVEGRTPAMGERPQVVCSTPTVSFVEGAEENLIPQSVINRPKFVQVLPH